MYKVLKVSTVLSWINIAIAGLMVLAGLFGLLMAPNLLMVISLMLTGSVILHGYAVLQLRKSIINPEVPLSSQTPTGIRFIGFMALFFGVLNITNSVLIIQNADEAIKQANLPFQPKGVDMKSAVRIAGFFLLLFGIGVAVNVFLSTRLLRWYMINQENKEE